MSGNDREAERIGVVQRRMALERKAEPLKRADRLSEPEKKELSNLQSQIRKLRRREDELSRPGGFEVDMVVVCDSMASIHEAMRAVKRLPLDIVHEVVIRPGKRQRRPAQNRLYWKWCTEIGDHYGLSKEECAEMLKEKFLINIFVRDDEDYSRMAEAILTVKIHDKNAYWSLRKKVINLTSTTACSVRQMSEYLTAIKRWAVTEQAPITIPEDKEMEWLLS